MSRRNGPARREGSGSTGNIKHRQIRVLEPKTPPVQWIAPFLDVSEFADEARGFITSLTKLNIPIAAKSIGSETPGLLSDLEREDPATYEALLQSLTRPSISPTATVFHLPGGSLGLDRPSKVNVARTMFETDRVPVTWIPVLDQFDEIWVPTNFNADTFADAGVKSRIEVVPPGVNVKGYHPDLPRNDIRGVRGLVFLSVFEWSARNGPDLLFRAWSESFSSKDDVTLIVRTYPLGAHSARDTSELANRLVDAELIKLGRTRSDVAPIVVIGEHLSSYDLARLYCTADVYVSPTRGEAWGRQLVEAQACGKPTIVTNWSAPPEILDHEANLFIEIEGLVPVGQEFPVPGCTNHRWASPSAGHLGELFRWCYKNPDRLKEMGRKGRVSVVDRWSWERPAEIANARLMSLSRQARRQLPIGRSCGDDDGIPSAEVLWLGDVASSHSLAKVNRELCAQLVKFGVSVGAVSTEPASVIRDRRLPFPVFTKTTAQSKPILEIRHSWPPYFDETKHPVAIMQPWEFGVIPDTWKEKLQSVRAVLTPSEASKETFVRGGIAGKKVYVVPNGVDTEVFSPKDPDNSQDKLRFLYVGGTIMRKGFDLALRAYLAAFKKSDDVEFVVKPFLSNAQYSVINMDDQLFAATADNSGPVVTVARSDVQEEQLADLYRSCDILLAPYRGEAFCLPVLEAMACGTPAIITDTGGTSDFADESTSWLVPSHEEHFEMSDVKPAKGRFSWRVPEFDSLVDLLRVAVSSPHERIKRSQLGVQRAQEWTWCRAGRTLHDSLREITDGEIR